MDSQWVFKKPSITDVDDLIALWRYAFTDSEAFVQLYFSDYYQADNTTAAYHPDGYLVASAQTIPHILDYHGHKLAIDYIVGVDTAPEARGGGIGRQLLQACFARSKERGTFLTMLMPFSADFYTPYQFAFCDYHYQYRLPLMALKSQQQAYGQLRAVDPVDHIDELKKIYHCYVQLWADATIVRDQAKWQVTLADLKLTGGYCYLLKENGITEGYILYYFTDQTLVVQEMAYINAAARGGLLTFLYRHRSQYTQLDWSAPRFEPLFSQIRTQKTYGEIQPFMMFRIIDVQQALEKIPFYTVNDGFALQVLDPLLAENNHVFQFCDKSNAPYWCVNDEVVADVVVTIEALAQLIFNTIGSPSLTFSGEISCQSAAGETFLSSIRNCVTYTNEYY